MRDAYFDQLDSIVDDLVTMTHEVQTAVSPATKALLTGGRRRGRAGHLRRRRRSTPCARRSRTRCFELLALQQPVAGDLRMLVASLRMVAELERMGDLSVHVAKVARLRVPTSAIPDESVPTIERMAAVAERMVGQAASVIAERDVEGASRSRRATRRWTSSARSSFREMLADDWAHGVEPAVDIALLGRYYERIADHAVSLARRVVYLVTGETVTAEAP